MPSAATLKAQLDALGELNDGAPLRPQDLNAIGEAVQTLLDWGPSRPPVSMPIYQEGSVLHSTDLRVWVGVLEGLCQTVGLDPVGSPSFAEGDVIFASQFYWLHEAIRDLFEIYFGHRGPRPTWSKGLVYKRGDSTPSSWNEDPYD